MVQLQTFAKKLEDDEEVAEFPKKAFRKPKSYHLKVMDLKCADTGEVNSAIGLLHGFAPEHLPGAAERIGPLVAPTTVTLGGFSYGARNPSRYTTGALLYGKVASPSQQLFSFMRHVREQVLHSSLTPLSKTQEGGVHAEPPKSNFWVNLINTRYARSPTTIVKAKGEFARVRLKPQQNFVGLVEKYQNEIWARDIALERLSLYEEGRKATFQGSNNERLIDEEYAEIASISLPMQENV